jgi:hypothetical protein
MSRHTDNLPGDCGDGRPSVGACGPDVDDDIGDSHANDGASRADAASLVEHVRIVLAAHHISHPNAAKVTSFVRELDARKYAKKVWLRYLARNSGWGTMDILGFIHEAQQAGDYDEVLWRAFLATHFGRTSADERAMDSAGRFLCGFETEHAQPQWTWKQVSTRFDEFSSWAHTHADLLATLRYGNHRKFESKQPDDIVVVMESFVGWVRSRGQGPTAAFAATPATLSPTQRFRALYDAFDVYRFGRTARFDCLLGDMALLPVVPDSCYIVGATGPRRGAELLCGRRGEAELGAIADELARSLSVPYDAVEDALCIWQKTR